MHRLFYFLLLITLPYALRVYYRRRKIINSPKEFFGSTIYVSNHAASFMDPLIIAGLRLPIVFFMTRSDVFTKLTRPILWAAHMLPIYRERDGVDTKRNNMEVFDQCARILSWGRNLLIFGEGFTDEVFVRRLKPLKKGAVRIGFHTLEYTQWKKQIYIATISCNYSDPHKIGSDLLMITSDKICLNDYKEQYLANPSKCIAILTELLENRLKSNLTHVEDIEQTSFHENIMKLTRKGMSATNSDLSIPLEQRFSYSKKLADWMNVNSTKTSPELKQLEQDLADYYKELDIKAINDNDLVAFKENKLSTLSNWLHLVLLAPIAFLGFFHCAPSYIFVKRFVEKTFKRRDFWPSVKLLMGMLLIGIYNIPFIFIFKKYIYPDYCYAILYYLLIGVFGMVAYHWRENYVAVLQKKKEKKMNLQPIIAKRNELEERVKALIPVA